MSKNDLHGTRFPTIDLKQTGQNIRNLMSVNHLTPAELASAFGFETGRAIYKWICGKSMPTLKHLACFSWLFEVPLHRLVFVKGESVPLRVEDLHPVEHLAEKLENLRAVQQDTDAYLHSDNFRTLLVKHRITLQELSEYLMLTSPRSISRWLAGSAKPSIDNLVAVSSVLDSEVDDLVNFKLPETKQDAIPKTADSGRNPCADCTDNFVYSDDSNSTQDDV